MTFLSSYYCGKHVPFELKLIGLIVIVLQCKSFLNEHYLGPWEMYVQYIGAFLFCC